MQLGAPVLRWTSTSRMRLIWHCDATRLVDSARRPWRRPYFDGDLRITGATTATERRKLSSTRAQASVAARAASGRSQ
jgi:hypothetical protein